MICNNPIILSLGDKNKDNKDENKGLQAFLFPCQWCWSTANPNYKNIIVKAMVGSLQIYAVCCTVVSEYQRKQKFPTNGLVFIVGTTVHQLLFGTTTVVCPIVGHHNLCGFGGMEFHSGQTDFSGIQGLWRQPQSYSWSILDVHPWKNKLSRWNLPGI